MQLSSFGCSPVMIQSIKQAASAQLFQDIEDRELTAYVPATVIAVAAFILCSRRLYNMPRAEAAIALARLVQLPGFHVDQRRTVLAALVEIGSNNIDFGD